MKNGFILFLFGCISCTYKSTESVNATDSIFYMKIEKPNIASLPPLRLSEFADSIEYVQLETTQESLLPYDMGGKTRVTGNLLFIVNLYHIYQFDIETGKFLRQIGRTGQGPGEYIQVNAVIDTIDRKVFVKSPGKANLLTYDFEGKYLGDMPIADGTNSLFTTCFYSLTLAGAGDEYFIFYSSDFMPLNQACHPHELIVYDYKNKMMLHSLPNRMEGKYERHTNRMTGLRAAVKTDDTFFYKSFYNDTLYTVNKEGIYPYAIIDLGNRKFPADEVFAKTPSSDQFGKILIHSMYIRPGNLYFGCMLMKEGLGNSDGFICKYNTARRELTYHSSIILNDIDGGGNVSIGKFTSNPAIIPVTPPDVVKEDEIEILFSTLAKSELKYPELKEKFERMQESRDPDDNPLLMILHMK